MSAISGPSATDVLDQTRTSAPSAFSALSSEQFIKIMFTELTNQDPLKPNDANQLLEQMSSLRNIESSMQMQSKLDALVGQNEFASASLLIGAQVSGVSVDNRRVAGVVASVTRTKDGPVMTLTSGARVLFGNVDQVAPPSVTPAPTGNNGGTGNPGGAGNTGGTGGAGGGAGGAGNAGDDGTGAVDPTTDDTHALFDRRGRKAVAPTLDPSVVSAAPNAAG